MHLCLRFKLLTAINVTKFIGILHWNNTDLGCWVRLGMCMQVFYLRNVIIIVVEKLNQYSPQGQV